MEQKIAFSKAATAWFYKELLEKGREYARVSKFGHAQDTAFAIKNSEIQ